MTLKNDIAADADVFYDTDEFGQSMTYNGTEIVGVIESGSERMENMVASPALQVRVRQVDVPAPAVDDRVVTDGRTYRVGEGGYLEGVDWLLPLIPDYNEYVEV